MRAERAMNGGACSCRLTAHGHRVPAVVGPNGEEEIAPYATFHLLGFREEMDPAGEAPAGCQTMAPRPAQHGRQAAPQVRTLVSTR